MLIALKCGERKVVVEADNYFHLRAECESMFSSYIKPGHYLELCYVIFNNNNSGKGMLISPPKVNSLNGNGVNDNHSENMTFNNNNNTGDPVTAYVCCPQSFRTFLSIWEDNVEQHQKDINILPTLYVVQHKHLDVPSVSPSQFSSEISNYEVISNSPMLREPFPSNNIRCSINVKSQIPNNSVYSSSHYPSHSYDSNNKYGAGSTIVNSNSSSPLRQRTTSVSQSVADLSYPISSDTDVPTIRAVMRCGEASVLVPFDPTDPPSQAMLLNSVRERMINKLRQTEADLMARTPYIRNNTACVTSQPLSVEGKYELAAIEALHVYPESVVFILSAYIPDATEETIDVDDDMDVKIVAESVLRAGNDYSVYLIVESRDARDTEVLAMPNSFFFGPS